MKQVRTVELSLAMQSQVAITVSERITRKPSLSVER